MSKALIKNLKAIANNSENVQIIELCDLAVRALADLEALRKESEQWDKTSLVEVIKERDALREELDQAYERAAKEADQGDAATFIANRIRALKDKPWQP